MDPLEERRLVAITIRLLMVYSLADQKLIQSEPFDNASDAMTAYVEAERKHYKTDDIEIVLVAADSIETIALAEGLDAHARSVRIRTQEIDNE